MSLKDQLSEDLKDAMRQKDDVRKTTIRAAMTAIKNAEVEARKPLDDPGVTAVLAKEAKQRRDGKDDRVNRRRDRDPHQHGMLRELPRVIHHDEPTLR